MKTRIVHTKIWDDSWFCSLSRASKLLFTYLLTNDRIGLTGVFELPDNKICYQTGITSSELEQCKEELKQKVSFFNDWVKIHNIDRYQNFSGSKNEIAKEKELNQISPEVLDTLSIEYRYPIDSLRNHKSEIRNKKTEIKKEKKTDFGDTYIDEFNELFVGNYKLTTGRQTKLQARLKTFTEKQIIQALRGLSQSDFHKGKNDTGWKADPDFLIRSDEQVDKWLNAYQEKEKPKKVAYLMGDKSIFAR